ncbi:hypothetical protein BH20ACI2_BH20ACI2_01600 [soil metagenome]
MVYPKRIAERVTVAARRRAADLSKDAEGVAANFGCGSFVRFVMSIDGGGVIRAADVRSNGCGYMVAAADVLAEYINGRDLTELHGLRREELRFLIADEVGEIPSERTECADGAIEALRSAFSDLRSRRVEEFRGEEALICTCFGVSQERIESLIDKQVLDTVEEVTLACNAGGGCGSCLMLIQELLDQHARGYADRV